VGALVVRPGLANHAIVASPRHSLVIPFYNEAGNVRPLLDAALPILRGLEGDFEAVLVDDGSTDATPAEIDEICAQEPRCRALTLRPNGGQAAALLAGLRAAGGALILTMDGDGQNDPADLPRVLAPVARGDVDLMCGIRTPRHDSGLRRLMSSIANGVRRRYLGDNVSDAGCQLRAFRREIIPAILPSPLLQSFIPAMAIAAGFRVAEMPVAHHPRTRGESKYGLGRLWWRPFAEMIRLRGEFRRIESQRNASSPPRRDA
jgi:dolichol-phosphate mannosyltransferase